MKKKQRILVVCPTIWERAAIASPELQSQYDFEICGQDLIDSSTLWRALTFDVQRYLHGIIAEKRDRGIDGVLATGDYPGCIFGSFIAEHLDLHSPRARD